MQRVDYRESSCLEKDPNYRDTGAWRKKPKNIYFDWDVKNNESH